MKPLSKVDTKWSPDLAYAIGLITTDGSLSKDGRHIVLVSKDKRQIETFKGCLGIQNKIGKNSSGYAPEKQYYRVQFGDVVLYRWLLKIGLTPNKTKTIGRLKIPNKYFFDFLRGHFDGDGSCYSYWDTRWKNSFMFYLTFVSASLPHVDWIRGELKKLLGVKGHISHDKHQIVHQLRYAKRETKLIVSKMYYNKNIPCLDRKYKKLQNILNTDNTIRVS